MKSMPPTLYGRRRAVSAGRDLAAAAGFAILRAGADLRQPAHAIAV